MTSQLVACPGSLPFGGPGDQVPSLEDDVSTIKFNYARIRNRA
jgi:hypothetical protein